MKSPRRNKKNHEEEMKFQTLCTKGKGQIKRDYHYEKFKEQYPQYQENYSMPKPKAPSTLENVDLSNKRMAEVKIDEPQKSVLCGTCLSDSSLRINKGYANARIQSRHSTRQASWFFWKWTVCLCDYTNGLSSIVFQKSDGFQTESPEIPGEYLGKLKVSSLAKPELTQLHSVICKKNKEVIERRWLNHMTDYFLMVVWLDDGSLFRESKRQGVICLDLSPVDQQKVFVNYLKTVWNIDAYVRNTNEMMKNGTFRHRIHIKDTDSLLILLRIVAPIIPVKEMLYKVMFVPVNDADLLQRWASEVSELVLPEFRQYMKDEYRKRINNYQKV